MIDSKTCIILTGMHRSNTSLIAKAFKTSGAPMLNHFREASIHNQEGYFEDIDIIELEEGLLTEQSHLKNSWYITSIKKKNRIQFNEKDYLKGSKILGNKLKQIDDCFVWKSPRSILFLDYWKSIVPNAKFIFIFRHPALVARSLVKRGDMNNFSFFSPLKIWTALKIWNVYNTAVLDFIEKYPEDYFLIEMPFFVENERKKLDLKKKLAEWSFKKEIDFVSVVNKRLINKQAPKSYSFIYGLNKASKLIYKKLKHFSK